MSANAEQQLVKYLSEAHAMERQALVLMRRGADLVGDEEVAEVYRTHLAETHEHARLIAERLAARGQKPSKIKDIAMEAGGVGVALAVKAAPETPIRLATAAIPFENLEIAAYSLICALARRVGDTATLSIAEQILEEEEAAAERIAGTFERTIGLALGDPAPQAY